MRTTQEHNISISILRDVILIWRVWMYTLIKQSAKGLRYMCLAWDPGSGCLDVTVKKSKGLDVTVKKGRGLDVTVKKVSV